MTQTGITRIAKPRCFLVYALAPEGVTASQANQLLNAFIADPRLPLALFHDHFIGRPGGVVIFFAETAAEREALAAAEEALPGWQVDVHPLIFSHSPAGFDEQIAFTLRAYRQVNWETLQRLHRPRYGDPAREVETAEEDDGV